jgi:hypothetical protein
MHGHMNIKKMTAVSNLWRHAGRTGGKSKLKFKTTFS